MSPDEEALHNGIAADPAADLPRLVYADWLEEHGHELRAEFIRVQCEIAKLEVGPRDVIDRNVHLWRRQQELLDGHMDSILEGVSFVPRPGRTPGPRFYRGFVDEIEVSLRDILQHAKAIVLMRPIPTRVTAIANMFDFELPYVIARSFAAIVSELRLLGTDEGEDAIDVVIDGDDLDTEDPHLDWPRLNTVTVVNNAVSISRLVGVLRSDTPAIKTLNIHSCSVTDNDVIDMLNNGVLQRLSHISLIENAIGDQAAIELADRLGNSPNLKELDLRRNGITTVGQAALLARLGSKVILF